jgi:hypothetical protein
LNPYIGCLGEIYVQECKKIDKKVKFYPLLLSYRNILTHILFFCYTNIMATLITKAIITALKLEADLIIEKFELTQVKTL